MQEVTQICWDFPGGAYGVAIVLLSAVGLIIASYHFTLRKLNTLPRAIFSGLRIALVVAILFCLCQPRVVKKAIRKNEIIKRKVAVVFDESSSMRLNGSRGKSRLDEAKSFVDRRMRGCTDLYDMKYFAFAEDLRPVEKAAFVPSSDPEQGKAINTRFYENVAKWNVKFSSEKIDGVVCLTDGIDTSKSAEKDAFDAVLNSGIPHIFVPARTPLRSWPYADLRKIEAPSTVKPNSISAVTTFIDVSGFKAGEKPVLTLKEGDSVIGKTDLPAAASERTVSMNIDVPVASPGTHIFDTVISWNGKTISSAKWSIQCVPDTKTRVLLYQGVLNWGTHFLNSVFANYPKIQMDVRYAPDLLGKTQKMFGSGFPTEEELRDYDMVILMNLKRDQIPDTMARTIDLFLENGGGVLFVIPSTEAAGEFANSPIEKMLPVYFEDQSPEAAQTDRGTMRFKQQMADYRRLRYEWMAFGTNRQMQVPTLMPMQLTREGETSPVFARKTFENMPIPEFQQMALIKREKPGAAVLAEHSELNGKPRPLLATQNYGTGRTAVLATDSLWRWRLSIASEDRSFDTFWCNLVEWLSANSKNHLMWELPSLICEAGKPFEVRFIMPLASSNEFKDMSFTLKTGDSERPLLMSRAGVGEYRTSFVPDAQKLYWLKASLKGALVSETCVSSGVASDDKELKFLTPKLATLKELAVASGGRILSMDDRFDFAQWFKAEDLGQSTEIKSEKHLWHNAWLFLFILGCILVELVLRRRWKLL